MVRLSRHLAAFCPVRVVPKHIVYAITEILQVAVSKLQTPIRPRHRIGRHDRKSVLEGFHDRDREPICIRRSQEDVALSENRMIRAGVEKPEHSMREAHFLGALAQTINVLIASTARNRKHKT